ncbi:Fic family protein [Marinobacter sp. AN1]|uniref:Fic family protein n=1 Tax=Marinobacter sp. AN1 TaxID=2886046 RepID=UPI00223033F6|nr:Fic family protein [Marinobacter sp. AN1]UZD64058.1 Fic family protein [Marinobacter sp. AN1]
MQYVGYAHLIQHRGIAALKPPVSAEVRPVARIETVDNVLAVPARLAPHPDDRMGHVLFAVKHEGINLQVLAQVLPTIPEPQLREAFDASPNSQYLRKVCYLWEQFTGETVHRKVARIQQSYVPLFDPKRYVTGRSVNNSRWRVRFNGLGSLRYCATVRRTASLERLLDENALEASAAFLEALPTDIRHRTLAWAYWQEANDSYAIEQESPAQRKVLRFVQELKNTSQNVPLSEQQLVTLQNAVLEPTHAPETSFRTQQNYLSDGVPGPLGVTYVPPTPELCSELMTEWSTLTHVPPGQVHPLVLASVVSLGFAFIHPFMDGNGRLSRYLFHHVLRQQRVLQGDQILPISIVLRRNQADYLRALQAYSRPLRSYWRVRVPADGQPTFEFTGHPSLYRYWDATDSVILMAKAVRRVLDDHLKGEVVFLNRYNEIYREVDRSFDVPHVDLSKLVTFCLNHQGRIPKHRRNLFQDRVPPEVFEALENAYRHVVVNAKTP